jgi:phosphate:Na+ symporter
VEAKRAAVSHSFFNIFGAFLTLVVLYPVYLWAVPIIGGDLANQVANFHVMVKTLDALLFLPIIKPFASLIARIVPEKVEAKPAIETPVYIDERYVKKPMIAIELAIKEILRLGQISRSMVKYAMDGFLYNDETLLNRVGVYKQGADKLRKAILEYVVELSRQDLSKEDIEQVRRMILSLNNFSHVSGHAVNLLELGKIKVSKSVRMVGTALNELKRVYRDVDTLLTEVSNLLPEFKR